MMILRFFKHVSLVLLLGCFDSFCLYSDIFKDIMFLIFMFLYPLHLQFLYQLCPPVSDTNITLLQAAYSQFSYSSWFYRFSNIFINYT